MKKIYIGNLSPKTKESQVEKLFAELGTIESLTMLRDRKTKRFKGSCFVEIEDDEVAAAAIEALNGKEIDGRVLVVNEVEAREDAASGWRAAVNNKKVNTGGKNRKRAGKRKASEGAGTTRGGAARGTLGNRGGGGDRG